MSEQEPAEEESESEREEREKQSDILGREGKDKALREFWLAIYKHWIGRDTAGPPSAIPAEDNEEEEKE
jgi:hypothetical protein